uniref:Uncharacterized protein n=1 Tax=Panagrolaimus sp. JU765 TaxID=591449 RepID=A0AC34RDJ9_9BILA
MCYVSASLVIYKPQLPSRLRRPDYLEQLQQCIESMYNVKTSTNSSEDEDTCDELVYNFFDDEIWTDPNTVIFFADSKELFDLNAMLHAKWENKDNYVSKTSIYEGQSPLFYSIKVD